MAALCDVIDRHVPLLLATDEAFHQDTSPGHPPAYLSPFIQFVREGVADGSLGAGGDVTDRADALWNAVAWTYTHLRGRHDWPPDRARTILINLLLCGIAPRTKE